MTIELLELSKVAAILKKGFSSANTFFQNPVPKGQHRFVDGITSEVKTVQMRNANPQTASFGGKTYSGRK